MEHFYVACYREYERRKPRLNFETQPGNSFYDASSQLRRSKNLGTLRILSLSLSPFLINFCNLCL